MRAQTLSICMPSKACDKECPYCVSKMTWAPKIDLQAWRWNLSKVLHFAEMSQVTDVIITGKGEPTLHSDILYVATLFEKFPVVLQTNGKSWARSPGTIDDYFAAKNRPMINVVSVSIDDPRQMENYAKLWKKINSHPPMTARITVMLTPEVCKRSFDSWVMVCQKYAIRGLTFREISKPGVILSNEASLKTAAWIEKLSYNKTIIEWKEDFEQQFNLSNNIIRRLPYGAIIKDFDGISVTKFDFCIQDSSGEDDIRSLIYNQDGHLYTSWSSPASLIF